jgi:hypothetical protein
MTQGPGEGGGLFETANRASRANVKEFRLFY